MKGSNPPISPVLFFFFFLLRARETLDTRKHQKRKTKVERQVDHEFEKIEREKLEAKEKRMIANDQVRVFFLSSFLFFFLFSFSAELTRLLLGSGSNRVV